MSVSGTSTDPADALAAAAACLAYESLPEPVIRRAKQRILDLLGCLVAGYDTSLMAAPRRYAAACGGAPEATLLPGGEKTSAGLAALVHAMFICGPDLSDLAPRATCHPGDEIIPAALAMAEKHRTGGRALITAVVAAYEAEIRFGRSVFPGASYAGWWTPALFGTIGAAVAGAHLLGLDDAGMRDTIGIAANLAPTAMARANAEGSPAKLLMTGQACAAGLLAAEMSYQGMQGMRDVTGGWLSVISGNCVSDRLAEGIGPDCSFTDWEILGVLTRYYGTAGPLTPVLDAAFGLIGDHDLHSGEIVAIEVDATPRTARFDSSRPTTEIAARSSLQFCLALAFVTRDPGQLLGPGFHPANLRDPSLLRLADKISISRNDSYERQYPVRSLAQVVVHCRDGQVYSKECDRNENPRYMTPADADIEHKFRSVATPALGAPAADRVVALVARLEHLQDTGEILAALRLPPAKPVTH